MNRRHFLREGAAVGILAAGVSGALLLRRNHARAAVVSNLLNDALPAFTNNALNELRTLPVRGREEIKRYFHGKCLNVESFVTYLCSREFAERLGHCTTESDKEACFLAALCSRLTTEEELLQQIETVSAELGNELDSAWSASCREISSRWNVRIQGYGACLAADELSTQLSGLIRTRLEQALQIARTGHQQPALGETIKEIGESALLLLPLVRLGTLGLHVGIPVFVLLAAKQVWDYVMGQLTDRRGDYQAAISSRLALLGNRVGAEFERELRLRLTDLHTWQELSLRDTAWHLANDRVSLL